MPPTAQHIHFVTGRLAEPALREVLVPMAESRGFTYSVDVLPITVAALMTPEWIEPRWRPPPKTTLVLLPGYCTGDLSGLCRQVGCPVERGPRELRQLPSYFSVPAPPSDYGRYDIEILAEINYAPRLTREELLVQATDLANAGADIIDLGCEPGHVWTGAGDAVRALRDAGFRVSIDSFAPAEVEQAVRAGAELVLSVNRGNCARACDWGVDVVAVPDDPADQASLDQTIERLTRDGVGVRIDPVLEPIGFGFARSLGRYLDARRRYPDAAIMMGIGNLTELTDVDTAGVNTLLLGFCQELAIGSVLTTQVIPWARTSVKECDLARRLVYHAVSKRLLPKHLEDGLIMLRDPELMRMTSREVAQLSRRLRDKNYRVFVAEGEIHVTAAGLHLHDADPFVVMEQLQRSGPDGKPPKNLTPSHTFYLGYEMAKAATALTLGKNYRQDEALDWGLATRAESHRRLRR